MIIPLIDQKIRNAFSSSAMQYDILASLQKEIGRELTARIEFRECSHILDVGMGTGWLTNRMKMFYPEAHVCGVDFAHGMIEQAVHKYETLTAFQADAVKLPFKKEMFDLVVSNLAYQWVFDHSSAFESCYQVMKEGGQFYITMFGEATLQELFLSIEEALAENGEPRKINFKRLAGQDRIYAAVKEAGFKDVKIKNEVIKSHFPNMMSLVKWVKDIGANAIQRDLYIGRDLLFEADAIYNKKYKDRLGVYATFEVLWIEAAK